MILQNVDRNISPANYSHLAKDQLLVTKIFLTHQGEGPFAGRPAFFLRLAGCNRGSKATMGCAFCDTAFQFDQGQVMDFRSIGWEFRTIIEANPQWRERPILVITGGEPMIQNNLSYFIEYVMDDLDCPAVQIESNGDRLADNFPWHAKVKLVVSPKVTRNGYHALNEDVMARVDTLKFLISADPASLYNNLPDWLDRVERPCPIYLSPITEYKGVPSLVHSAWLDDFIDRAATETNYRYAAMIAKDRGFRLSMQTHLFFGIE